MGIFSKLFNSGPDRKVWPTLASCISKGLEDYRDIWFSQCIETFQARAAIDPNIKIINTQLEGKAESAIKAYQIFFVTCFLVEHAYIPPSKDKDFADILYAQICGTKLPECMMLFKRYYEVENDGPEQLRRFSSDVAEHITGKENVYDAALSVNVHFADFVGFNHIVLASCFGDRKTVKNVEEKLLKLPEKQAGEK